MPTYIVLVPEHDEAAWRAASEEERQLVYDSDGAFAALLAARGGKVTGGAELANSRQARTLRHTGDDTMSVTEGPYAETVEQLSGFYLVECPDRDTLIGCLQPMVSAHGTVEVRPVVTGGGDA